ncbi:IS3 family transposase [Levilactobacillus spicheri]|uniref:Transposase n=2 Tax=Levilactobacillus TaxID=2767886 RepID=A0A0F3RR03_9LACO|nr:IS3 family transposase [Levilactobacillus spicheri]KJW11991.1 transposase [Levilactobacillus spicheri]KJW12067.1 transposase [Levilactobacillus spicheri]KJW12305.1 transposase [Levilactobacillus spicheri]KJW12319.1 transposase [Levilactobacillus spicheri]KJW12321.1 transposase [Levilactobacillus spicheri]
MTELRRKFDVKLVVVLKAARMSSSSYHDARHRKYQADSSTLVDEIRSIRLNNPDYGYRTVTLALKNKGIQANHKAVLRIMRENNLLCQAFNRRTKKYNSYKGNVGKIAHNRLRRRFKTDRSFQKVVTDVTEVRWGEQTVNERAYFTAYIDLYNGEIIEWAVDRKPTVDFVTRPLKRLLAKRPDLPYRMTIHSDQGFQYQNHRYVNILQRAHVFQSMSRKATCLDNAVAESIFHILKVGTVHNHRYKNYKELESGITNYIDYYNHRRIKAKLAGMSPVKYREHTSQLVA